MNISLAKTILLSVLMFLEFISCDTRFSKYKIVTSRIPVEVDPILNVNTVCKNTPSLHKEQLELCKTHADVVASALQGAQMAVHECQRQLRYYRWNCSALETKNSNPLTSPLLARGFRETAFVYAIISAGMAQAIATSCRMGKLASCGCDETIIGEGRGWIWGGCSDNAIYASKFAGRFMDSREKSRDIKSQMNLHNNQAGRLAMLDLMKTKCKCNGVSGSCSLKTCWKTVPQFSEVGTVLKEKYDFANLMRVSNRNRKNRNPSKIRPSQGKAKLIPREDLAYYESSPSFCRKDRSLNIHGTEGRVCKVDSLGTDNCNSLCCDRGYNMVHTTIRSRCRCHFNWCCYVLCSECVENAWVTICK
ncbi:PREDICTED: protein Wnt-10a-like [Acropora digitifera]|uniref:protein Wnt-10a-like n=1 Tax=Acropora digitifera TaxID=70779 RepID=UPI00077AC911|nr:PREDICTED: protein Wnt-10a-like [Acropora digitifera]